MYRKSKTAIQTLVLLLLILWSGISMAENPASVPASGVTAEFITWETLQSPAGQVAVILLITRALKYLFVNCTGAYIKYIVYSLALLFQAMLLFVPSYTLTVQRGILAVINGFVIATAAMETLDKVAEGISLSGQ